VSSAEKAKEEGVKDIFIFATHGLFSKNAIEDIEKSPITKIFITDSVLLDEEKLKKSSKIEIVSVALLIAEAIRRLHNQESFKPLYL
jgi:ribose-phosphate pyrophosphokinase